ncbi:glycerophosphodiester phosphodiesterase family protein [Pedobacter agri]|uniref:Glycerophosphodiester phosphodiesterase family protein n=1 Tax=Pedobacter agri TaxID=454586 RepID=A0A9X3I9W0_9SPHI|nr:glycerophosphodiester phosphodiesterase family protein [Pedobacter agri]MCX3265409.1 glycerophosphodiester phosphodiesterase family protein [Pedobacter agri]
MKLPAILLILFAGTTSFTNRYSNNVKYPAFSAEAHRGGRGLMPENTIPAMLYALKNSKVTTLEMDTHITKDLEVVVTHDDYLSRSFTLKPDGTEIAKEEAKKYVVYEMGYQALSKFIVGSKDYPAFPEQQKVKSYIPRLGDLIDSVQRHIKINKLKQCFYDIEIKSSEKGDDITHPKPEKFADLVVAIIRKKRIANYTIIQSFDKRALQVVHQKYPDIKLSYLANNDKSYEEHIHDLGFKPFIIGSSYKGFNPAIIAKAHADGVKVLTATVNTKAEIEKLKKLKIDGIMTDYPNLF